MAQLLKEQNKYDQMPLGLCNWLRRILPMAKKVADEIVSEEMEILNPPQVYFFIPPQQQHLAQEAHSWADLLVQYHPLSGTCMGLLPVLRPLLTFICPAHTLPLSPPQAGPLGPALAVALPCLVPSTLPQILDNLLHNDLCLWRALGKSRAQREWALGSFLWFIWKHHMKEVHDSSYHFIPDLHSSALSDALAGKPMLTSHPR